MDDHVTGTGPRDSRSGPVGCLLVPRLPLACELADQPDLWHRPVVVTRPESAVVWSASPAASAEGIREGQRLSEAMGRCPTLVVRAARPALYEARDAAMLDAIERIVPGVEPAGPGLAYVDLAGLGRSYGSPDVLHAALLGCVPDTLRPRLGVGPTKFVASLAASRAPSAGRCVVDPSEVAELIAPIPVDALPVDAELIRRLRLVGITTVGELVGLRRSALVAQFGREGERLADLLAGAAEPVRPRPRVERLAGRLVLTEPVAGRDAVLAAAGHLLDQVLRHPRRGDRLARQLVVRAETDRGTRWETTVTLREARGDRAGMWPALAPVLERARLPGPVGALSLELRGLRPVRGRQRKLLPDVRAGKQARYERVEESLRQLRVRYGRCPVGRMTPVEPWNRIPERRWALVELE